MNKPLLIGTICSGIFLAIAFIPVLINKYRMKARSDGPGKTATAGQDGPVFFSMFGSDSGSSCSDGGSSSSGCDGGGGGGCGSGGCGGGN